MLFCQPFEHEFGHGDEDHGLAVDLAFFVVSDESPVLREPSEGALDDPAFRLYSEAFDAFFGADDFHAQATSREPPAQSGQDAQASVSAVRPEVT